VIGVHTAPEQVSGRQHTSQNWHHHQSCPQGSVPASPGPASSCPCRLTNTPCWFRTTVTPWCLPLGMGTCSETVKPGKEEGMLGGHPRARLREPLWSGLPSSLQKLELGAARTGLGTHRIHCYPKPICHLNKCPLTSALCPALLLVGIGIQK
jgi:hypothetical protein